MALPPKVTLWTPPMDPADLVDYEANFATVLEQDETISSYVITVLPEAVLHGLTVREDAPYQHVITNAGTRIKVWLEVLEANREDENFGATGVQLGIQFTIFTSSNPPRRHQRTFGVSVQQL